METNLEYPWIWSETFHTYTSSKLFCSKQVTPHSRVLFFGSVADNQATSTMSYFVIGVSGVTCGGKTTMSKLLKKSFPWARVIHQDKYFYPESYEGHIKLPEIDNHINFDVYSALDMEKMHRDVREILSKPELPYRNGHMNGHSNGDIAPNFAEGLELLRNLEDIDIDTARYSKIPILIIEGYIMFESEELYDKCDVRYFLTLDEETCRHRRSLRVFDPPDGPGYFDYCIWPEYQRHYKNFVEDRAGINVFSGKSQIKKLWRETVEIIAHKLEEKYPYQINALNESF